MRFSVVHASFGSLVTASVALSTTNALYARDEDGTFSCYTALNILDFSGICPNINWPITNDRGLYTMGTLYFAMASTDVPDDTVYNAQENIICTVNAPTHNITATVGAGVGGEIVEAGASVTFSLAAPNFAGTSICMFTEGTGDDDKNITDPITLAQARSLLYTMLTAPNVDCKTCARIPIRYPQVQDGTSPGGGIFKIDVTSANNCLGKCVGPNSFSTATPTPTPMPSQATATRIQALGEWPGPQAVVLAILSWLLGIVVFHAILQL